LSSADKWVFGDKETGFILHKFSWTSIQRHAMVTGTNSPDDPALQDYWHNRELSKIKTLPVKSARLAKHQSGKCPVCGESLFIEEDIEQHHIMPRKSGGTDTPGNLILVHYLCHQQLTVQQRQMGYL
jgi:RNA-directed DNA polymerase